MERQGSEGRISRECYARLEWQRHRLLASDVSSRSRVRSASSLASDLAVQDFLGGFLGRPLTSPSNRIKADLDPCADRFLPLNRSNYRYLVAGAARCLTIRDFQSPSGPLQINAKVTLLFIALVNSYESGTARNRKLNLDEMSVDEMWCLHEEISRALSVRLTSERRELEKRLAQLRRAKETSQPAQIEASSEKVQSTKRKYPRVFPKYRNPKQPSETWSGRGKQPRWVAAALNAGQMIEELLISDANSDNGRGRIRQQ